MRKRSRKAVTERRTKLGRDLEEAAGEILAHLRGEITLPSRYVIVPGQMDVRALRENAKMSQSEFAKAFCINPRTLQDWEQGRRKPDTTSRAYLTVIASNRQAVLDALGTA